MVIALAMLSAALAWSEDPVAALGGMEFAFRPDIRLSCRRCSKRCTFLSNRRWPCSPRPASNRCASNLANPRVLYFNDSVAVGWVRGGFIELAAQDPGRGIHFYALQQRPGERILAANRLSELP